MKYTPKYEPKYTVKYPSPYVKVVPVKWEKVPKENKTSLINDKK